MTPVTRFRPVGRAALAVLALSALHARADVIRHFDPPGTAPGQFGLVSQLLNFVSIGSLNAASETTATSFRVPGSGLTDVTFNYVFDNGAFNFSFGMYELNAVTADSVGDRLTYATQALAAATEIFDDRTSSPGASRTVRLAGGQELGFYLIPNNTLEAFRRNPAQFYAGGGDLFRSPLFSVSDANPGRYDQFLSFLGNGRTLFTFEDLTRAGPSDLSFGDIAFRIDAELVPGGSAAVPEPATVVLVGLGVVGAALVTRRRTRNRRE